MNKSMKGRTCLVTGANSGIGKALCLSLAKQGASLIMVCRNSERGESARSEIIQKSGNSNIELYIIDLSSRQSIRNGTIEILNNHTKLDLLVNNAGVLLFKETLTEDGIESTLATNFLAPFLLTSLLLPALISAAPSKIINVVSEGLSNETFDFDKMIHYQKYDPVTAYTLTKQAGIFFTYELAQRLSGTGITANCFYPGFVLTNLGKAETGFFRFTHFVLSTLLKFLFLPVEESVRTGMYLISSKKASAFNGKFLVRKKNRIFLKSSSNRNQSIKLWKSGEELTGARYIIF